MNKLPGNEDGYAKIGIDKSTQKTAMKTNPIHQAPTQTLLCGVSPNLYV